MRYKGYIFCMLFISYVLKYGQSSYKIAAAMQVKKKAEALKDNRDYSFLLSDDADIPSPPKEKPAARPSFTQKSG
jgi:protein SPT2